MAGLKEPDLIYIMVMFVSYTRDASVIALALFQISSDTDDNFEHRTVNTYIWWCHFRK